MPFKDWIKPWKFGSHLLKLSHPKTIRRYIRFLLLSLIGCWATLLLFQGVSNSPASAAISPSTTLQAPVIVDGREIFTVGDAGQYRASNRAQGVSRQLAAQVAARSVPKVAVELRNEQPTLVLNNKHLLTVTELDAQFNRSVEAQANDWQETIHRVLLRAQEERQPTYRRLAKIKIAIASVLAVIAYIVTTKLWKRTDKKEFQQWMKQAVGPRPTVLQRVKFAVQLKLILARIGILGSLLFYSIDLFPESRQWSYFLRDRFWQGLRSPLFSLGDNAYNLLDLGVILALCVLVFWGSRLVTDIIQSRLLSQTRMERGIRDLTAKAIRYGLIVVGLLILLQTWGIDLRSVALLGSALGVGLGLGLQNIARDFGSGIVMLFERAIQSGDYIEVGEYKGTVEKVGARSMVLRTVDKLSVIVPNTQILESAVVNWNHERLPSRLHLAVGVAYQSNPQQVKQCLLKAADEHPEVLRIPEPEVFLQGFGDSSLDFTLLVWIREPMHQDPICSDLRFRIEELFREQKIEIPFPQMDLHLRSSDLPSDQNAGLVSKLNSNGRSLHQSH